MQSLLCQDLLHREQRSLGLPSTWHTARVGSDQFGAAHSGSWVYVHFRVAWTMLFFPLRLFGGDGFSDVLTAYGPSCLAAFFLVSSPEEYSYAEFSRRSLPETFRIQRYLV